MKRRAWLAALAVGLGAGVAIGQESAWRSAARPAPVVRAASGVAPSAILGRPVAIARAQSAEPRPFPEAYRNDPPPRYGRVEPIATGPTPGAVIAVSATSRATLPVPVSEEPLEVPLSGDLFAADRQTPAVKLPQPAATLPLPVTPPPKPVVEAEKGNWLGTFPVGPPEAKEVAGEPFFHEGLPPTKWYIRGEYLLWWAKNDKVPPLVATTANPNPDRNDPNVGTFNDPFFRQLFGGELNRNPFSGFRGTAGYYLDDCGEKAIEFTGFFLGQRSDGFRANSFNTGVITRPFLQANPPPIQTAERLSFPGDLCGEIRVNAPSQLWGLEPNILCKWCCDCNWRVDMLAGVRYLNLRESVTIAEDVIFDSNFAGDPNAMPPLPPSVFAGNVFNALDRFAARNQFYGGQVGVEGRWQQERFTLDGRAKLALGVTQQQLDIDGFQIRREPNGNVTTFAGGLLALPGANIGSYERDRFSVVPELTLTAGYYVTDRLRVTVGYNALYWSNVLRPGNQIDTTLNANLIPNFFEPGTPPLPNPVPNRPVAPLTASDYWVQGITAGLEFRY